MAVNLSRIKYIISHINGHWIPTRKVQIRFEEFCPPVKFSLKMACLVRTPPHAVPQQWVVQVVQCTRARWQGPPFPPMGPTVESVFCFPIQNVVKSFFWFKIERMPTIEALHKGLPKPCYATGPTGLIGRLRLCRNPYPLTF